MINAKIKMNNIEKTLYKNKYIDKEKERELAIYLNLLHGDIERNDNICLLQINRNFTEQLFINCYDMINLINIIREKDMYISVNTFHIKKRAEKTAKKLNALFLDLDYYNIDKLKNKKPEEIIELLKAEFEGMPAPSFFVVSGKGLYVFWLLNNTFATEKSRNLYKKIQESLCNKFTSFGADIKAKDIARVLRIPTTINSKNNKQARLIMPKEIKEDEFEYSLNPYKYELSDFFEILFANNNKYNKKVISQSKKKIRKKNMKKITKLNTIKNLYYNRAKDIEKIVELRKGVKQEGKRDMILFIYRLNLLLCNITEEESLKMTLLLNNKFVDSLNERYVIKATESAVNNVDKYKIAMSEYDKSTDGELKEYLSAQGIYIYKNQTIIDALEITSDEMLILSTLIDATEKKMRARISKKINYNKEKRAEKHKKEYKKQTLKKDKISKIEQKIIKLKSQNLTRKEIIKKLKIKESTYKRYVTNMKKNGLI